MPAVAIETVATYLDQYFSECQREYALLTAPPPSGAGFPAVGDDLRLDSGAINCHLARDGAVLTDETQEPPYNWSLVGGPAFMVDYDPTRVRPDIQRQRNEIAHGGSIGIYRIVAKTKLTDEIWLGQLPEPIETLSYTTSGGKPIAIASYEISLDDLLQRLTFGAIGGILDLHLPLETDRFWLDRTIRRLG